MIFSDSFFEFEFLSSYFFGIIFVFFEEVILSTFVKKSEQLNVGEKNFFSMFFPCFFFFFFFFFNFFSFIYI